MYLYEHEHEHMHECGREHEHDYDVENQNAGMPVPEKKLVGVITMTVIPPRSSPASAFCCGGQSGTTCHEFACQFPAMQIGQC
jgi:hypothetical protein